jgi:transcriptional regulator with XRE-family HTH domain
MKVNLKKFRVNAGMTQADVAAAVGVSQPNYQRWEAGAATVPDIQMKKLTKVLNTSREALLGRHEPIEAAFYDDTASDYLSYYGEVAVHFCGGGEPLLLSISEDAFTRLHRDLQKDDAFVLVESLANQTVVLRTKAISDVYFSSEAFDDYGPLHGAYANHVELQLPDPRDWGIIECLANNDFKVEDFDPAHVKRVEERIMTTDSQYERLVAEGRIPAEDLESEREKNQLETDRIFSLATLTVYQLSTGERRSVHFDSPEHLYDAFYDLVEFGGDIEHDGMIRLEVEGRHRIVFINKASLDYVAIPTHKFCEGKLEADAEALES